MVDPSRGSVPSPRGPTPAVPSPRRVRLEDIDELQLRREYGSLPKGSLRWASSEGQMFLKQLTARVAMHGQSQVAAALDVTRAGLANMLSKVKDDLEWGDELPSAREMTPLVRAYEQVRRYRESGRRVSRGTPVYYTVHAALTPLVERYDLGTISGMTKINKKELDRFTAPPDMEALVRLQLAELLERYAALRPGALDRDGEPTRRFFTQLQTAHSLVTATRIANTLAVPPDRVRGWLRRWEGRRR